MADGWRDLVDAFFQMPTGLALLGFLQTRIDAGAVIFPAQPLRALALTSPEMVRVVILGQDPYHRRGQADGLAFSVASGMAFPPSLRNLYKELHRDLGQLPAVFTECAGSLEAWARAGTLLLNTCLTVEEKQPTSHSNRGWEVFTDMVIRHVSGCADPSVFMLWGARAQSKRVCIDEKRHLILVANHPSPLSAMRPPIPFIGCGHFSVAQRWLAEQQDRRQVSPEHAKSRNRGIIQSSPLERWPSG